MADNFNVKQFLAENKLGAYSRLKEDNIEEVKRYQIGDMWSPTFDYKGMLKAGAALTPNADAKVMQAVSDSFEDVNYHRENSHLQDAIKAKEEGDMDAVKFHLALFKDELVKTIKSIKETQIFERKKVEEGEAAYEYEKGKAAGEKEEKEKLQKEDLGQDRTDAEAAKMMDFLAEYEVIYVYGSDGKCYRKDDEGNYDQVDRSYCQRYAGSGVREEKEEVKETLSGEAYARMDGLADQNALASFRDSAYYIIAALREDGFDDEDILEFLKDNLNISFN